MKALYTLHNLTKYFASRTVLSIGHLSITAGQLHVLSGDNGAGKSTLLSVLAFLEPPSQGELRFNGQPVCWQGNSISRLRRQVTLVHQNPFLFAGSVADNVAYGLGVRGIHGRKQQQLVEQALDATGLAGFGQRLAGELSGGEVRRVALARCLVLQPSVLLLDEPLANVDRTTAVLLERLIAALPQQGTTVIMTTHEADHAERLGGQEICLVEGRLAVVQPNNPPPVRCLPPVRKSCRKAA